MRRTRNQTKCEPESTSAVWCDSNRCSSPVQIVQFGSGTGPPQHYAIPWTYSQDRGVVHAGYNVSPQKAQGDDSERRKTTMLPLLKVPMNETVSPLTPWSLQMCARYSHVALRVLIVVMAEMKWALCKGNTWSCCRSVTHTNKGKSKVMQEVGTYNGTGNLT